MTADIYTFAPLAPAGRRNTLNEAEHRALEDLVHDGYLLAYVMYVSGFRRRMDYLTRTVGGTDQSRVSLDFLGAMLERHPKRGSHWGYLRPSTNEIRGELSALEKVGLIRRLPKKSRTDPLLFCLPLADAGSIRAQEEPQRNPKEEPQSKTRQRRGFQADEPQMHKADEQHITGMYLQQHQADVILQAYHKHLSNLPQVLILSDGLLERMTDIWSASPKHQQPEFWAWFFGKMCRGSGYIMGRDYNQRKGPFKANLAWLLDKNNFQRILNGEFS